MDSVTQIVLGAAVGEAVLGRKIGNRAMLWGAIAGTIPDLDVFVRFFTDPITATEMHRGISHSLFFSIVMAPVLAWIAHKIHRKREGTRREWTWLFFWCLVTHPLLDMHTTWGTQFFWPLDIRITYKNISVVDPIYTLPFLICVIIAMCYKRTNPKRRFFNNAGLIFSSAYMLLTFVFKGMGISAFSNQLKAQKIDYVEMDTQPTMFNSILWSAQIETKNGYRMGYYSLLDSKEEIHFSQELAKNDYLLDGIRDQPSVKQILKIADGWYRVDRDGKDLLFYDLRFGQFGVDPDKSPMAWVYSLKKDDNGKIIVKKIDPQMKDIGKALSSMWTRIKGN